MCVAVLVVVVVFVLSLDKHYTYREDPRTDNAYVGGDTTQISARVPGYLTSLPVADNQMVHAGDLVATSGRDPPRAGSGCSAAWAAGCGG